MDFEAQRQQMVEHWVKLYFAPGFGPEYARWAVREYVESPGCSFRKIGFDVKAGIDTRNLLEQQAASEILNTGEVHG